MRGPRMSPSFLGSASDVHESDLARHILEPWNYSNLHTIGQRCGMNLKSSSMKRDDVQTQEPPTGTNSRQ